MALGSNAPTGSEAIVFPTSDQTISLAQLTQMLQKVATLDQMYYLLLIIRSIQQPQIALPYILEMFNQDIANHPERRHLYQNPVVTQELIGLGVIAKQRIEAETRNTLTRIGAAPDDSAMVTFKNVFGDQVSLNHIRQRLEEITTVDEMVCLLLFLEGIVNISTAIYPLLVLFDEFKSRPDKAHLFTPVIMAWIEGKVGLANTENRQLLKRMTLDGEEA